MSGGHTRGPWGLREHIDVWVMAGGVHVATIPRAADGDWSRSNANLIAAAPELLSAVKLLREVCGEIPEPYAARIDAAIAKAEGRS